MHFSAQFAVLFAVVAIDLVLAAPKLAEREAKIPYPDREKSPWVLPSNISERPEPTRSSPWRYPQGTERPPDYAPPTQTPGLKNPSEGTRRLNGRDGFPVKGPAKKIPYPKPTDDCDSESDSDDEESTPTIHEKELHKRQSPPDCETKYVKKNRILNFESLGPPCFPEFQDCPVQFDECNIAWRDRGAGSVETEGPLREILFSHKDEWRALNCSMFSGEPKGKACGEKQVVLYSGPDGESPHIKGRPMRFNTIDLPYKLFDLLAITVYPIVPFPGTAGRAFLMIAGHKRDGKRVDFKVLVNPSGLSVVTYPQSLFEQIGAFDIWVETEGSKRRYPFTIVELHINDYEEVPKPQICKSFSLPEGKPGPCVPSPTSVMTFRADFDGIPNDNDIIPETYRGLNWGNSYLRVFNKSNVNSSEGGPRIEPGTPLPVSGDSFGLFEGEFHILSDSIDNRFGVDELSVLCSYPQGVDALAGKPCVVSFVGRRDPYGGWGLPTLVEGSFTISNPGDANGERRMTKIKLKDLTKDKLGFQKLVRLDVIAEVGDYDSKGERRFIPVSAVVDDIWFTQEPGEGEKCRVRGDIIKFDELPANSFVPDGYKGFRFSEGPLQYWKVAPQSSYAPGTPGYLSVTSKPNSIIGAPSLPDGSPPDRIIDGFLNATDGKLFDFISATITIDIPATDRERLSRTRIFVTVSDACGATTLNLPELMKYPQRPLPDFYLIQPTPGKNQIKFNRPYRAISAIRFDTYNIEDFSERISIWIDDMEVAAYDGPIPGCTRCAFSGLGSCEFPVIPR